MISNNKKKRVHSFNEKIGVHTVFNAHKPAKKGYFLCDGTDEYKTGKHDFCRRSVIYGYF